MLAQPWQALRPATPAVAVSLLKEMFAGASDDDANDVAGDSSCAAQARRFGDGFGDGF